MKTIGFIGTGVMGCSMIRNLMKAGFTVYINNRTKAKAEELIGEGAIWCDTPGECAAKSESVITIVGYPKDVEEVYFGTEGILEHAASGTYLIDMTTTSPALSARIYEEGKKRGLRVLDAPVSGGDIGARKGTLAIMVGGEEEDFDACHSIFEAMGSSIIYEGPAGSGQHVKMANQIAIAGAVSGVCEAISYTRKMGLDVTRMIDTIKGGAAGSWQLENLGPKMAAGNYDPGFYIKHMIKDLTLADEGADNEGLTLPILKAVRKMYEELEASGHGEDGTQGLIQYYD